LINFAIMRLFLISIFVFCSLYSHSQENTLSQILNYTPAINPAFVGLVNNSKIFVDQRNQWLKYNNGFNTSTLGFDKYIKDYFLGVGGNIQFFKTPTGFSKTNLNLQLSEVFALGNKTGIRFGVQNSLVYLKNSENYIFGDQLNNDGVVAPSSSDLAILNTSKMYWSLGVGTVLFGEKWWIGTSFWNINQPQTAVIGSNNEPINYNVNAGYRFFISNATGLQKEKRKTMATIFNYKKWAGATQLELSAIANLHPILLGAGYRGMPILKSQIIQNDAFIILVGYRNENIVFAYNYDIPISYLGFSTTGSHEISCSFLWGDLVAGGRKTFRKVNLTGPLMY